MVDEKKRPVATILPGSKRPISKPKPKAKPKSVAAKATAKPVRKKLKPTVVCPFCQSEIEVVRHPYKNAWTAYCSCRGSKTGVYLTSVSPEEAE